MLNRVTFEETMAQYAGFSGVVYVRQESEVLFAESYGHANRADQIPNTIDTRFAIASGTKLFTGIAVCQLVEQEKLTFDTRLQDVVTDSFPHFDPSITVQHLLTHTSGAPDYFDEEKLDAQGDYGALWAERPVYSMRSPRDFLPMFQNEPMKFSPDERFSYSNGGYILLGLIIEAVTGQPYTDYVTANVLQKAGMPDSGFFAMNQLPARTANGYINHPDGTWRTNIFEVPIIGGADGGVFVTAPDMSRWWDALFAHRLLSEAMTAKFLTPHVPINTNTDNNRFYGYGIWMQQNEGSIRRYYGVGADPGVSFSSAFFPQQQIELTLLSNTDDDLVWDVVQHLVSLV